MVQEFIVIFPIIQVLQCFIIFYHHFQQELNYFLFILHYFVHFEFLKPPRQPRSAL